VKRLQGCTAAEPEAAARPLDWTIDLIENSGRKNVM